MNVHPLFVHFPIGLLVVYILMVLAAPYLKDKIFNYNRIKIFLLFVGTLSLYPTIITGFLAADVIGENDLIETHESMALITATLFSILAGAHLLRVLTRLGHAKRLSDKSKLISAILRYLHIVKRLILNPRVYMISVLLALAAITITGALGASIVYGPQVDPFVSFIYNLFL